MDDALFGRYSLLTSMYTKLLGFELLKELYANDSNFCTKYGMNVLNVHLMTFISMRDLYSRKINFVCLFVIFVSYWLEKVI